MASARRPIAGAFFLYCRFQNQTKGTARSCERLQVLSCKSPVPRHGFRHWRSPTYATQVHCRRLYEHARHYENKRQSLAPVRAVLEPLLEAIETEIRSLEPGSSQESINRGFQVSIFDRTTSSSDSVPSVPSLDEARTPHRPSPLPLVGQTMWGTDIRKPSLESPASIGSARGPRIAGTSPYQGYYDDVGYESDRETPRFASHPMRKNASERTEQSQVTPREESHQEDEGWQVVSSNRRGRKLRVGRDLGSFRPTPARATHAELDRRSALGTVARSTDRRQDSSEARRALSEVHSRSPTPPRRNLSSNLTSFWQRRPLASTASSQRTWANVAAGQDEHPRVQPLPPAPVSPIIPPSPTRPSTRQGNPFSSPLTAEFIPDRRSNAASLENSGHLSTRSGYDISPRTQPSPAYYPSPASGSSSNFAQPRYINNQTIYNPPTVIGPNPSRLPYANIDDSISLSSKRRLPLDFHNDSSPTPYPTATAPYPQSPNTPPPPRTRSRSPSPYPPYDAYYYYPNNNNYLPAGYYSQPMSRDTSRQSHISSAAETEPLHFPSHPPYYNNNNNSNIDRPPPPSSPRDRHPNGQSLRKWRRSDTALPPFINNNLPSHNQNHHQHEYDLSKSLPGLGTWASDHNPMSRTSSGPGLAIEDPASVNGLGIVPFEGLLRFGALEPVDVGEARRRAGGVGERGRR